jgi:hypothetical protein
MKTRMMLCLVLLLTALSAQGVSAKPALPPDVTYNGHGVWTVYPHNISPDDPDRIQAAVDLAQPGDTVRLGAGTFDFSEFETVRIAKDLTIEGAWDNQNQVPLTTILHGYMPILIGRKTPLYKPEMETVNGHQVYHITKDVWAKIWYPFAYTDPYEYQLTDDWVAVHVDVRQLAFERPYFAAIFSSGSDGGTIEKVHVVADWPMQTDYQWGGSASMGIGWLNVIVGPFNFAEWGRAYYPHLFTVTDLVRGRITVQDSFIDGDEQSFMEGEVDEAGDVVALPYDPANPEPPNGDYAAYVLQDVAFEWDDTGLPIPESIQLYWVKKGYAASFYGDGVWAERGVWAAVYSGLTQGSLTARNNVIQDAGLGVFFLENGFYGVPFTGRMEGNQIIAAPGANFATGLWAAGWDHYNPFTDEWSHADPGMFITARDNTVQVQNPDLDMWSMAFNVSMYGEALVSRNKINLASGSGIQLGWPTTSATVLNNAITGTGDYALWTWYADGNWLTGNDLHTFTASGAGYVDAAVPPGEILLISDDNRVIGDGRHWGEGTVWDLGANNTVLGMQHEIVAPLAAAQSKSLPRAGGMDGFGWMRRGQHR